MNKKIWAALGFVSVFWSAPAAAAIETYAFSGVFTELYHGGWSGEDYYHIELPELYIWEGIVKTRDRFHGTFSFDSELTADGTSNAATFSLALDRNPNIGYTDSSSDARLVRYDRDRFNLNSSSGEITFAVNQPAAPGQPFRLNTQIGAAFFGSWSSPFNNGSVGFHSTIDSFVKVSPVPEPSTYGMLLAGVALLAAARSRRRITK